MHEKMNTSYNPFATRHDNKGFTLMELLIVITLLSILIVAVMPYNGRVQDNEKRDKTEELLKSLRFALVGDEFAVDAHGNRFIGGYIGDFGALPDLIVHEWDKSNKEWDICWSTVSSEKVLDVYDTSYANTVDKFNQNAIPLALWTNYIKLHDSSDNEYYQEIVDTDTWEGPYINPPRDDYTNDDNFFTYTDYTVGDTGNNNLGNADVDENRKFWLRQGYGRLTDAWGSALLFYMHEDDLYVVSGGSDRRINYGEYYLWDGITTPEPDYNNGPADLSLSGNEDNLVMVLTKEQWDLTAQKVSLTRLMLQDLKKGIVGEPGRYTGGVEYPNGFVADIGNLETLVGTYIAPSGTTTNRVYKSIKRVAIDTSNAISFIMDYTTIKTVDTANGESIDGNYPFAYSEGYMFDLAYTYGGTTIYPAQPSLLLTNADYVKRTDGDDVTYYRYIHDDDAAGKTPETNADYWVEDDTFAGHDWVLEYDPTFTYTSQILPTWKYYDSVGFGAGWRGPYTSYTTSGLNDAWGREIVFEMDKSNLVIRSRGPIEYEADGTTLYEADDITEIIAQREYAVPVTVTVEPEESSTAGIYLVETTSDDLACVYFAYNGGIANYAIKNGAASSGTSIEGTFSFTSPLSSAPPPSTTSSVADGSLVITDKFSNYDYFDMLNYIGIDGIYLPVGKVMVVYHNSTYYTVGNSSATYASPHPTLTEKTTSTTTTKYTYQKNVIIQPRTNPTITLGD